MCIKIYEYKGDLEMINLVLGNMNYKIIAFVSILIAYILTGVSLKFGQVKLPKDGGREFAHEGQISQGKPRGAGLIFILVFALTALIFLPINNEFIIYIILTIAAMLSGYLDDCSKSPWGEYKKGILDLIIAIMASITYINFNIHGAEVGLVVIGKTFMIPTIVFGILSTILVWVSINVTNCADGVDGLCGMLSIITLLTIYAIGNIVNADEHFSVMILIMVACLLGYLWFNATPSKMIMGDAGSRAIGLFISIAILKIGHPLLYIPVAFILIMDGGLGLIKVFLLRFLKIHILRTVRTPIHDHVRKNLGWSNAQTVFKFAIIQTVISFCVIWLMI
jgi:phospho-N-acetylmuramoyl-pentapeptide-transferase